MLNFRFAFIASFHTNFLDFSHRAVDLPFLLLLSVLSLLYELNVSLEKVGFCGCVSLSVPSHLAYLHGHILLELPFSGDERS